MATKFIYNVCFASQASVDVCFTGAALLTLRKHVSNPGSVQYGMVPKGTQHSQATSKEDKIKLEPSVATGCVDGSTPMVWYGSTGNKKILTPLYLLIKNSGTQLVIPTVMPPVGRGVLYANNCAWASILTAHGTWLNASVTASASGKELVLSAAVPAGMGAQEAEPVGSSYAWGSVPMMNAYDVSSALPVLP